jgi:DNA-binding transcriptional LysR family regulator
VDLDQLRFFVATATNGGFTAAANAEGVAQPQVFRRVKALERELGIQLFERVGRNVQLAPRGERLLKAAQGVLDARDDLLREAGLVRSGASDHVRIACYPIHIPKFLGPWMRTFRSTHPEIAFDLSRVRDDRARDGLAVLEDLWAGTVDFAISTSPQKGLDGIELYESRVVVVLPDDHPMREATHVGLESLDGLPLLVTPEGHYSRQQVEYCLARLPPGPGRPYISAATANVVALLALGASGAGVPIVADLHIPDAEPETRRYPGLKGPDGPISTVLKLFVHPSRPLSDAASLFHEHVRATTQGSA